MVPPLNSSTNTAHPLSPALHSTKQNHLPLATLLTSSMNHWQKAGAIHSLAWIPQSIQIAFFRLPDSRPIWDATDKQLPCKTPFLTQSPTFHSGALQVNVSPGEARHCVTTEMSDSISAASKLCVLLGVMKEATFPQREPLNG